jgi:hypothetical protein
MKPSEIVYQLRELNINWRKQNFQHTKEQSALYDRLIQLRRERVQYFYANNLVFKGSKAAYDKELAEEAAQVAASQAEVEASEEY